MNRTALSAYLSKVISLIEELSTYRWGGNAEYKRLTHELLKLEPGVKRICNEMQDELGNYTRTTISGWRPVKEACTQAIGILQHQDDLEQMLEPSAPNLRIDRLHPQVWNSARTLWRTGHYHLGVQQAAEAVNAMTQAKTSRRDVSNTTLARDCFNLKEPTEAAPRLRLPGPRETETWKSVQEGTMFLGMACFMSIRNPTSHTTSVEMTEHEALEQLAVLSVYARRIESAIVERKEDSPVEPAVAAPVMPVTEPMTHERDNRTLNNMPSTTENLSTSDVELP